MLLTLYTIIVVVLLFGLTIFVHELGHFLVARSGNANDQYYGSAYYPPPRTYVYRQSYCPPPVVYQSYSYAPGYRYGYGYNSCAPRYYSHHHHYCR